MEVLARPNLGAPSTSGCELGVCGDYEREGGEQRIRGDEGDCVAYGLS
jgi:hypothetical protein